ncbi:MAG: LytTR family DNA-binding domain-containing protein, partial [Lachnospiraceae bacterium]|nr:LytTR family DNA-binding domain-containing protein [Lachnospiraceae bacterium]
GLEVARFLRIVNKKAQLIFVTHMAQFAIKGYEVDAMDFIVKPVDQIAIDRVLDKALKRIDTNANVSFALKTSDGIVSVSSGSIYFVEVYDHDLIYHTEQGDIKVRGTLGEVRSRLDEKHFIQCSRSYLVNMRYIKKVSKDFVEVNGVKVPISQSHRKEIEQRFIKYLGENI